MTTDSNSRILTATIAGAPNAGKSTLTNKLCGEKISIVSHHSQTTRMPVMGAFIEDETQVVLVDTPGLFKSKDKLDETMIKSAQTEISSSDMVLFVVDSTRKKFDFEEEAIKNLPAKLPSALVLNKIDEMHKPKLIELVQRFAAIKDFDQYFMISSYTGDGVPALKSHLISKAAKGHWLFPADQATNLSLRQLAEEITREKLFHALREELPHGLKVETEQWVEKDGVIEIHQNIITERDSHRKIIIGKGGEGLKKCGTNARKEISRIADCHVRLFLHVKVDEKWRLK